jgi:ribulose-phosphate 3-epimerase
MDGHFVPNISFGPQVLAALRPRSRLFFDTHLMLLHPDRYLEAFAKAGADRITVHAEADHDVARTLTRIRELGIAAGIALNPDSEASAVLPHLEAVDLVLCMTVFPGFGGQAFIPGALETVRAVAEERARRGLNFRIQVDGGITPETAAECRQAGADTLVAGTSFFKAADPSAAARNLVGR